MGYTSIAIRVTPKGMPPIWLTTVEDNSVSASSTITEYPIVDGSMVSDHMYKEPVTFSINGSYGYNDDTNYRGNKTNTLLSDFQSQFEKIKNEGILCDLVKITTRDNGPQFLKRTNMALQSISWVEKTNSLSYTFNFKQVLSAEVGIQDVDTTDIYLPPINELQLLNFTDTIVDWDLIDAIILNEALQSGLIEEKLLQWMSDNSFILIGTAFASLGTVLALLYGGFLTVGPVGWILVFGLSVFLLGKALIEAFSQESYTRAQFRYYSDDAKNREEAMKVGQFMSEIHTQLMKLNNAIHVYQVPSNEPHEAVVGIEDMYYIFRFEKRLNNVGWKVSVRDINDTVWCSDYPLATNPKSTIPPEGAELR